MKISYNNLKQYIPELPDAKEVADIFTFHVTEVDGIEVLDNGDTIFDLKILPDRAHDLLSHRGVAYELSGLLGLEIKETSFPNQDISSGIKLNVDIEEDCARRYSACVVENIKVGGSPEWMKTYLTSIGGRSINNIVDATNIVMYDLGQPTHAFDLNKISTDKNNVSIKVAYAKENEELKLVGREGIIAKLSNSDVMIQNGKGENLALAGIKGGFDSGVSDDTTSLVLEVANFHPISTRKSAKRLSIYTDSAKRFENDLSPSLCDLAMQELSALIKELCPDAKFGEIIDVYKDKEKYEKENTIEIGVDFINKKLGTKLVNNDIEQILKNYKYKYIFENNIFKITVPLLRSDLKNPIDIVDEIGRIYGYDKVGGSLPDLSLSINDDVVYTDIVSVRNYFLMNGYSEVMTYTFVEKGEIEILASASDKKFLRTNLLDGLKRSYEMNRLNMPLLNLDEVKIFEVGKVFLNDKEETHVAYINKKENKEMIVEEFVKGGFAGISKEGLTQVLGSPSQSLPDEKARPDHSSNPSFEIPAPSKFKMWSAYPFITRDIAVWVSSDTDKNTLVNIYKKDAGELLVQEPRLFDSFTKGDNTSYAYRLVFQSYDRTLVEEEVNTIMQNVEKKIKESGFTLR